MMGLSWQNTYEGLLMNGLAKSFGATPTAESESYYFQLRCNFLEAALIEVARPNLEPLSFF